MAIKAVPELLVAQVWDPCKQCTTELSTNLCCMERASFINSQNKMVNLYNGVDDCMFDYLQACEFHRLQIDFSYLGQNLYDLSICKNSLAHYIAKARLSLRFAVCLSKSEHSSNEHYVIEFFLQPKCKEGAYGDSSLDLLSCIMDTKLKSFKFVSGGQHLVHLRNPKASESCDFIDIADVTNHHMESFSESSFTKYLETVDLCCQRPSFPGRVEGWVFSRLRKEIMSITVKENIEHFMKTIALKKTHHNWIVQFWAPKMVDRCYLETWDQLSL